MEFATVMKVHVLYCPCYSKSARIFLSRICSFWFLFLGVCYIRAVYCCVFLLQIS